MKIFLKLAAIVVIFLSKNLYAGNFPNICIHQPISNGTYFLSLNQLQKIADYSSEATYPRIILGYLTEINAINLLKVGQGRVWIDLIPLSDEFSKTRCWGLIQRNYSLDYLPVKINLFLYTTPSFRDNGWTQDFHQNQKWRTSNYSPTHKVKWDEYNIANIHATEEWTFKAIDLAHNTRIIFETAVMGLLAGLLTKHMIS